MRTKKGSELIYGDEFKDGRLWYRVVNDPVIWPYHEGPRVKMKVAQCSTGREYQTGLIEPDADYQVRRSPAWIQFRGGQRVNISYSEGHPIMWHREAWVMTDDGGEKVLVSWQGAEGPKIGARVVAYHGKRHEQLIPRERLSAHKER